MTGVHRLNHYLVEGAMWRCKLCGHAEKRRHICWRLRFQRLKFFFHSGTQASQIPYRIMTSSQATPQQSPLTLSNNKVIRPVQWTTWPKDHNGTAAKVTPTIHKNYPGRNNGMTTELQLVKPEWRRISSWIVLVKLEVWMFKWNDGIFHKPFHSLSQSNKSVSFQFWVICCPQDMYSALYEIIQDENKKLRRLWLMIYLKIWQ